MRMKDNVKAKPAKQCWATTILKNSGYNCTTLTTPYPRAKFICAFQLNFGSFLSYVVANLTFSEEGP